jgi:hypothetical protein
MFKYIAIIWHLKCLYSFGTFERIVHYVFTLLVFIIYFTCSGNVNTCLPCERQTYGKQRCSCMSQAVKKQSLSTEPQPELDDRSDSIFNGTHHNVGKRRESLVTGSAAAWRWGGWLWRLSRRTPSGVCVNVYMNPNVIQSDNAPGCETDLKRHQ